MLNKNAKKWVAALKNGEYKQTTGQLNNNNKSFCCLGVACEIYQKEMGDLRVIKEAPEFVSYDGSCYTLPNKVTKWLNLIDNTGEMKEKSPQDIAESLVNLNDTGKSFEYIAEVIEKNTERLFND